MSVILIFLWVWVAFIAISFWEAYMEGRSAWAKDSIGWRINITKNISLTGYHFFLFWVMIPLFMTLPLVIGGWNLRLLGILISAYFSGLVIEDFMWFVVNPVVSIKEWGPKFVDYYPWIGFGIFKIPVYYLLDILIALLSWWFIWK